MHISIVQGETTTRLSDSPTFNFESASIDILGQNVSVTPDIKAAVPDNTFVTSINGVQPNSDGEFFIDGSECDSWALINGGTTHMFDNDYVFDDATNGISLVDLCPACKTCESIYRLQYEVESLKMWINTLKDVNLYMQDDMEQRRTNLGKLRITNIDDKCAVGLSTDDAYMQLKSAQLLQQYMTVVHMWNYVVSQNNSSNVITIAPEDTTGFVVQTKRALPSCAGNQRIWCTIRVDEPEPVPDTNGGTYHIPENYPISIYVPEGSLDLSFEPFDDKEPQALQGASIHATSEYYIYRNIQTGEEQTYPTSKRASFPAAQWTETHVWYTDDDHKSPGINAYSTKFVYTDFDITSSIDCGLNTSVAGTYVVTAKFLPFVHYTIYKGTRQITIRGGTTVPVTPTPIPGSTTSEAWDFGITDYSATAVMNPTNSQYLEAKTTPTCSVDFKLRWPVHITWWIDGKPEYEDYMYVTNGIRMYYGDNVMSQSVLPDPVPVTPTSNTNA